MKKYDALLKLFAGNKDTLNEFLRRVASNNLEFRDSDPPELKIALRAYGKFIASQIENDTARIQRVQQRALERVGKAHQPNEKKSIYHH